MILYVNSCIRKESRTNRLAKALLDKLGDYEEIRLADMELRPVDEERLKVRTSLIDARCYDDMIFDLAKQFAGADLIVVSAPFWDGQFPAILRTYIENIYAIGIVSAYDEKGNPQGLCRAKKLYYVTTAGGNYDPRFSFDYLDHLARDMFGIAETELIYAENLDIEGNDAEQILARAIEGILTVTRK
ncbi:MAG: NAD(P)H-dependent oxidoreductase [Lachnospiraceae bacterium]|nr:NAD(P)H-dependent oxidoreductase [Lachnospiraceae bacterium]